MRYRYSVTDDLRDRENDIIWRVNIKGQRVYVYILLEFQSGVDKFMAVRMMGYLALLYQDLIHRGNLTASAQLPPVFPIVLYNGQVKWCAKRSITDLIEDLPGALRPWAPQSLPGRLPGVTLPEFGTILEAKTMLAERVIEWTQNWKEEGIQEGMQKGQIKLLRTMLEARFGVLPDWALVRLKESSSAEIDRWCLRILNQSSLQEVLD